METETSRRDREAPIAEVLDGLNDLLQLDHDAVGAYEIAIEKLENREHAQQIESFRQDHERHIRELNGLILGLGGTPTNEPHSTAPLKQALQQAAAAAGDRALLMAWRANELQVTTKYDGYAQKAMWWPSEAKRLVDRNALDEERHYRWAAKVLGDPEPAEIGFANRAREEMNRARNIGRDLRGRVGEVADRAREVAARVREGGPEGSGLDVRALLEDEIRSNPARSLLVTFGVAFLLGRTLR